jgi:purine nucleosidase
MKKALFIDTDTASDDAVALVLALGDPAVEVRAITVVAGNVPLDQGVQNALYTRDLCGSDVPVYAGAAAPLTRPLETAQLVHGQDGMGDIGLPLHGRTPDEGNAVEAMIETVMGDPGTITIVTLGPLTNLAEALIQEPRLASAVADCYVMGGKVSGPGNITPLAEYNLWVDPEAAAIVAESNLLFHLVGWDMSVRYATFDDVDAAALRACGPLGEFCVDIQATLDEYARRESGLPGFDLPDPIAMAVAIEPSIARFERHHLDVRTEGADRGRDVVDWDDTISRQGRVRFAMEVDRRAFVARLHDSCRSDA